MRPFGTMGPTETKKKSLFFFVFRPKMGNEKRKLNFLHFFAHFLTNFGHFWWFFKVPLLMSPVHCTMKNDKNLAKNEEKLAKWVKGKVQFWWFLAAWTPRRSSSYFSTLWWKKLFYIFFLPNSWKFYFTYCKQTAEHMNSWYISTDFTNYISWFLHPHTPLQAQTGFGIFFFIL